MKTVWEDIPANSREARRLTAQAAAAGAGLIVFPEFTFTGFTKTPTHFADTPDHPRQLACAEALTREFPLAVACGRIVASEPLPRNNLTLVHQGRTLLSYDKLHSYSFGGETAVYGRGERIMTTRLGGLDVGAFICYDLRFPEIFQAVSNRAHVIIVAADWPGSRREHWQCLLKARAIENQCYILGINSVGDQNGLHYTGDSCVILPDGTVAEQLSEEEGMIYYELADDVEAYRRSFPVRKDRRPALYAQLQGSGTD